MRDFKLWYVHFYYLKFGDLLKLDKLDNKVFY